MLIRPADLSERDIYELMIGTVIPRPISWTATAARNGTRNLAPIAYWSAVSHEPPIVSLTIEDRADGGESDTLTNMRATGEFTVNTVSHHQAKAMLITARKVAPEVDEFELAGVTPAPAAVVAAPLVADSLISIECQVRDILRPGSHTVVWGSVVAFHAPDRIFCTAASTGNNSPTPTGTSLTSATPSIPPPHHAPTTPTPLKRQSRPAQPGGPTMAAAEAGGRSYDGSSGAATYQNAALWLCRDLRRPL